MAPPSGNDALPLDRLKRPLHDLRISLTDQCSMRCEYCMPAHIFGPDYAFLSGDAVLTFEEIERLSRAFARLGVKKLRLTGGEPLLRRDVPKLVSQLRQIDGIEDIALTTNGLLLPRLAKPLAEAGLHRVTVSLDALDDALFRRMNDRNIPVERVFRGIDAAYEAGLPVKVNAVIECGVNEGEIVPLAAAMRERGHTLRFIEFMDVGNVNGWSPEQVYAAKDIVADLHKAYPLEPVEPAYRGEVARRYRYVDGQGEVGIISSVTEPFCGDCSRSRISAEGKLFTCLFATVGLDLRSKLRKGMSDAELVELLTRHWGKRNDRYSELREEARRKPHQPKVEMSYIGG